MTPEDTQALILSSGGADGAYEVGVLRALFAGESPATNFTPLNPEIFVGSSIGAFNASYLVSRMEETDPVSAVEDLKRVWLEGMAENPPGSGSGAYRIRFDLFKLFAPENLLNDPARSFTNLADDCLHLGQSVSNRLSQFITSKGSLIDRSLDLLSIGPFISNEPFVDLIKKEINFDNIQRSKRNLEVVLTHWNNGTRAVTHKTDWTPQREPKFVQASGALPGIFEPVEIDGQVYVDGGALGYARLVLGTAEGADKMHVVYVNSNVRQIPFHKSTGLINTMYRLFVTEWINQLEQNVQVLAKLNQGMALWDEIKQRAHLSDEEIQEITNTFLFETRLKTAPRRITAHRYRPDTTIGGFWGMFDLNRDRIADLIEQGYNDARHHDCQLNKCILPDDPDLALEFLPDDPP